MKRDWDVIRDMLARIESIDSYTGHLSIADFQSDTFEKRYLVSGHMQLLIDRGLVYGVMQPLVGIAASGFTVKGLTWEGHEFLDSIRNDTVWHQTKETFVSRGLDMSFETIKAVTATAITSMLGLSA